MTDPRQPAYPELHIHHFMTDNEGTPEPAVVPRWMSGLTKEELFAAMAMQGILSSHQAIIEQDAAKLADVCVAYARALIARLNT